MEHLVCGYDGWCHARCTSVGRDRERQKVSSFGTKIMAIYSLQRIKIRSQTPVYTCTANSCIFCLCCKLQANITNGDGPEDVFVCALVYVYWSMCGCTHRHRSKAAAHVCVCESDWKDYTCFTKIHAPQHTC